MQFKHPEILYALFLLLIPIIIHLFQLRKFQRIDFTNVAFLQKVTIQTRKSSQLKKWLTLLMRLLAMACIIVAFAQPFTASRSALNTNKETVVYVDNSFSMQAKGPQGPLLQRALQDLFEQTVGNEQISWFTNNQDRRNVTVQDFKNELLRVDYTQKQLTPAEVVLKAQQLFSNTPDASKQLIYISDFQQKEAFPEIPEELRIDAVPLRPVATRHIGIDTAYIASKSVNTIQLKVVVSASETYTQPISVSLYKAANLIAKSAVDLSEKTSETITFDLENTGAIVGYVTLNDLNIVYDNTLFFSSNAPEKIKVLSINEANANFLQRLFDQPEFEYIQLAHDAVDYNTIPNQNFIILNELEKLPSSLVTALRSFVNNGGSLLIIPSETGDLSSYNSALGLFGLGSFAAGVDQERKITQIVFDHPLYENVFEKRVVNFQYPKVNSYFPLNTNATSALAFEDGKPFLIGNKGSYLFATSINSENSNFQNSPLIVPTLYNMAQQSLPLPKLYYEIGKQNQFSVPVTLLQDEIVKIRDSSLQFIPLQQTKANKVDITTQDEPATAGTYQIEKGTEFIQHLSFNYDRDESVLQYADPEDWEGVEIHKSVEALFETISEANSINSFWKWFAIFALLFLVMEMLILKFYK
ncbi:BatA domain-containing protein [Altibacter sp.]|uniref:BatA domain-containing protein n=1 Tax=Altibacter sp. TaxID=2024823 RepID=UPI00258483F9|nr:BatA domain-containing protein [Altibacter sp.]MCW9038047.1 BatA domain-containing protein [Altibacter sp.]